MTDSKQAPCSDTLRRRTEQNPEKIRSMFDRIAGAYDRLNRILTVGVDRSWRRKAVRALGNLEGKRALDLCSGTGDMVIEMIRQSRGKLKEIVALDFSGKMLDLARPKIARLDYGPKITLRQADVTNLPLPDNSFDLATVAFGIRNVSDIPAVLSEVRRTLKAGGRFVILEFSMPRSAVALWVYRIYLRHILPRIGGALSGDKSAYRYLNQSAEAFPPPEKFAEIISQAGFGSVSFRPLTLGLVTIYVAE